MKRRSVLASIASIAVLLLARRSTGARAAVAGENPDELVLIDGWIVTRSQVQEGRRDRAL